MPNPDLGQSVARPPIRPPLPDISGAELLSGLHDGTGPFIGSALIPWRCGICRALIFPGEVHQHPTLTTSITKAVD